MTHTSRVDREPAAPRVVDIHAHAVPTALMAAMRRNGERSGLPSMDNQRRIRFGRRLTPPVPAALSDVSARLAHMDRTGVDLQVISPWMELSPAELAPSAAASFLRHLNDGMGDTVGHHRERLRALALVDRRDPATAAAELVRTARMPGFVGIELPAGGTGPHLHDAVWNTLWQNASDHQSLVLLHPWQASSPAHSNAAGLIDIVDNPAQSTAVIGGMILSGVFERFADLRVCVVHAGGFLPYQAGRFDAIAQLQKDWHAGNARPSSVLRRLYYDSLTHSTETLAWLVDFAGSDHVMLGSDFPFSTGVSEAARAVRRAGLDDADTTAVLGGTARRLLGC